MAFVMALLVMVVSVIVLTSVGMAVRAKMVNESAQNEKAEAERAAESGVQRALAALVNQSVTLTTLQDDWYTLSANGDTNFRMGSASFRVQIVDACSKLDINTASEEWLLRTGLTQDQVDSIIDWRSSGNAPSPQGAKDEYYNALPNPYNTKDRRFDSFNELLLVKGIDAKTLYDPPTNSTTAPLISGQDIDQPSLYDLSTIQSRATVQRPTGEARLNCNNANQQQLMSTGLSATTAQAIINRRNTVSTFSRLGQVFEVPGISSADAKVILDNLTTDNSPTAEGKIDLNTADEAVLNSIPDIPPGVAQAVVARGGQFNSLGEFADIPGVTPEALRTLADYFTVSSQSFLVRVVGKCGSAKVALEASVYLDNGSPVVNRVTRPWFTDAERRWGWADQTTSETVLMEPTR